jgi:hypothetical protein
MLPGIRTLLTTNTPPQQGVPVCSILAPLEEAFRPMGSKEAKKKQMKDQFKLAWALLQIPEHPDKKVQHKPGPCDCGHVFSDEELSVAETRQVFDLPQPKLEVTAHQLLKGKCPGCGKWHKGIAPEGVNAPVQYGYGVKTLAVLLNVVLARASIFGVMASVSP